MESNWNRTVEVTERPEIIEELTAQIHQAVDELISQVRDDSDSTTLLKLEKSLWPGICLVYRLLVAVFLARRHATLDLTPWKDAGWWIKKRFAVRKIKTQLGVVTYGRTYLKLRDGPGCYPLDAELGISSDGFSWRVVDIVTELATRVSYSSTREIAKAILGWSPSTEAIESLVIGLGSRAPAFMETCAVLESDGEVLVIEVDGKAAPMATEEELAARRGRKKHKKRCPCGCQRHRGRMNRKRKPKQRKQHKKRGNNSKNGRSATLVAMYTLRRGEDGKLHGPINKKVWGQFGKRYDAMCWARDQATRRGFGPDTDKQIQIVIDGERCLRKRMTELFPNATLTLDIRHPQERLWKLGRLFHEEGSPELEDWVEPLNKLLIKGRIDAMLKQLRKIHSSIAKQGPGTKAKREGLEAEIRYVQERKEMMRYGKFREQDLVLATGVIEGACRYVIGQRLDCSGMRWTLSGAQPLLQLRCIQCNGDWAAFIEWAAKEVTRELQRHQLVQLRSKPFKTDENLPKTIAA